MKKILGNILVTIICVLLWQLVIIVARVPGYILASPEDVCRSLIGNAGVLFESSLVTLQESLLGIFAALLCGIATAILLFASAWLRSSLLPLLVMFNSFPKVAVAPLLVVWFGLGLGSKVALSAMLAFFPITVSILAGFTRVDTDLIDLLRGMSASRWVIFRKVNAPNSLPYLADGLKIAIPLSIVGAIVGEFVGARQGLGYLLLVAGSVLNTSLQYAAVVMMGVIALVPLSLLRVAEKVFLVRWRNPSLERSVL